MDLNPPMLCPLPQAQKYPSGRSVTEMEVMQFLNRGLRLQPSAQALIYFRDSSFLRYLPWPLGLSLHRIDRPSGQVFFPYSQSMREGARREK